MSKGTMLTAIFFCLLNVSMYGMLMPYIPKVNDVTHTLSFPVTSYDQRLKLYSGITHTFIELQHRPTFHRLPKIMQKMGYEKLVDIPELRAIVDSLEQKKRPLILDAYVWRMAINQGISHITADHVLHNLNRLFADQPLIHDESINWDKERQNKLTLIAHLNCPKVRAYCAHDVNDQTSICLQEFAYGRLNPSTTLVWEGPFMQYELVEHCAHIAGCCNVKTFDIKNPRFEYAQECHHQFCCE